MPLHENLEANSKQKTDKDTPDSKAHYLDQAESTARVTRSRTKPNHFFQSNSHARLQKRFGDRVVAFTIYEHLK